MSEPAERTFTCDSEEQARAMLACLPAREVVVLAKLVGMANADARAELVEHIALLISQARALPGQAHEMDTTLRAKGDKVRGPVRAKLSIPSKPWPR